MKWSKSTLRQYMATLSCFLCGTMTGDCFVWYTPIMVWMAGPDNDEIRGLDNDKISWLIAIIKIGELLGPVPSGYIADRWGRKLCLLFTFPLVISSWLIVLFTRSLIGLGAARILQGFAIAMFLTVGPVYVAEIAEPNIRGELIVYLQTLWYSGVLYSYSTGPFLSYFNYILISTLPAFLFCICFLFMPESPYFYLMKDKRQKAEEALSWLRGDVDVQQELKCIEQTLVQSSEESRGGWSDLFLSKACRKPLVMIMIISIIKFLSGMTAIANFATQTFSKSVEDPRDADLITIAMGVILIVTTILAAFIVDRIGRKPLTIFSTFGIALSSAVITIYYYLERQTSIDVSNYTWIVYANIALFCVTYNVGIGPVQNALQAEYFPSNVRAAAGAYTTVFCGVLAFVSIKQYQVFDDNFGVYSNFLLFTITAVLGIFILIPYMDETAKKSLDDTQKSKSQL